MCIIHCREVPHCCREVPHCCKEVPHCCRHCCSCREVLHCVHAVARSPRAQKKLCIQSRPQPQVINHQVIHSHKKWVQLEKLNVGTSMKHNSYVYRHMLVQHIRSYYTADPTGGGGSTLQTTLILILTMTSVTLIIIMTMIITWGAQGYLPYRELSLSSRY